MEEIAIYMLSPFLLLRMMKIYEGGERERQACRKIYARR